jgi:dipeptidyl aminopeptidase/acylaminoacyl peptidase
MKWILLLVLVVSLAFFACCGGFIWLAWKTMQPTDFPEQPQDYAAARKTFKTKLTKSAPAPQAFEEAKPPQGVTEVNYTSGTLKLKAWVNRPAAGGPKQPAVIFLHGGFAFGEDDWTQCKPFRDAGFVTMTPMLRGENGLAGSYSMFYDEVDDVLAAAEVLAEMPGVDPNRIYIAGHSVGGTIAMLSAMTSNRFKGCASFSGSPDQPVWIRGQEHLAPFDINDSNEMAMRSPLAYPKSFKCPVRIYWGDQEILFKAGSERLAEKASANGQDVKAIEVIGDHMTSVDPAMLQAVAFFQQQQPK